MNTKNESDQTQRNQKFKYLTTNMQNLLKNFNENLSSRKPDSRLELLNRIKQHQLSLQPARALVRSKTMTNRPTDRPLSHMDPFQEKPKINRSQSQLNYNSLHRNADTFDFTENNEEKIRKSKSSQQIQMNCSFMSDSYNSDSAESSRANSPKKADIRRRSSTILIENPKSVVLRREKTPTDTDLPLMKQKLLASIKRSQSITPGNNIEDACLKRIADLESRIMALESELSREKKKLAVEREEKYELVSEIKMRCESEKASALKALEAKLNTSKLFEVNKLRESIENENKDELEQNRKYYENELNNLKAKLQDKNERCSQLEKLLKDEHLKSERLFLKSIELVRKFGQKSNRESICSNEIQAEYPIDLFRQKLVSIRQVLSEEDDCQELKNLSNIDDLIQDIEIRSKRVKQQNQTQLLDLKIVKESKLKLESLYKIKCKSDLNKSAKIHKLEINYQSELLKLRNEFNSDLVRYLEHKLVLRDAMLNDLVIRLSKILNILNISDSDEPCELIRENLGHLVKNLINSLNLNEPNLQGLGEINASFGLENLYKKAPVNLVDQGMDNLNPDYIIRKIDNDLSKEKLDRTIQDELLELDKHLNNMKMLSNSLTEQTLNKGSLKPVRANSKNSSNCSSCDISNSSHSFIELEEASDLKFGDKPNVNLISHKTYKKKPNYELIVQ